MGTWCALSPRLNVFFNFAPTLPATVVYSMYNPVATSRPGLQCYQHSQDRQPVLNDDLYVAYKVASATVKL
jgi:hypothetical protein